MKRLAIATAMTASVIAAPAALASNTDNLYIQGLSTPINTLEVSGVGNTSIDIDSRAPQGVGTLSIHNNHIDGYNLNIESLNRGMLHESGLERIHYKLNLVMTSGKGDDGIDNNNGDLSHSFSYGNPVYDEDFVRTSISGKRPTILDYDLNIEMGANAGGQGNFGGYYNDVLQFTMTDL